MRNRLSTSRLDSIKALDFVDKRKRLNDLATAVVGRKIRRVSSNIVTKLFRTAEEPSRPVWRPGTCKQISEPKTPQPETGKLFPSGMRTSALSWGLEVIIGIEGGTNECSAPVSNIRVVGEGTSSVHFTELALEKGLGRLSDCPFDEDVPPPEGLLEDAPPL